MGDQRHVIFGAGKAGKELARSLSVSISYFVDNDPRKWGTDCDGRIIDSPQRLLREEKELLRIYIGSMFSDEIKSQLLAMGFGESNIAKMIASDIGKKVLEGKENWLFLQNDTNSIIEQNNGTLTLMPDQVKKWVRTLEARFSMLAMRGIKYYFLVVPNKESVYSEYLPDDYVLVDKRPVHLIEESLIHSFAKIHYPIALLKFYKRDFNLYSKVDTHWNAKGAFVAYRYLAHLIAKDVPIKIVDWGDIEFKNCEIHGDLGGKLIPPQKDNFIKGKLKEPSADIIFDNEKINTGNIKISLNKNTHLPTAAIFHDSFMGNSFIESMIPYIIESFSQVHFYHTASVDFDEIDKIKPDVVISELVERFMINVPSDF